MQTENNEPKTVRSKVSVIKVILWMLFFIFLFLLIPFFGIPLWLSSESGRNMIVSKVNRAVSGELKIDDLSMGWFSGVKVSRLDFSDEKGCTKITANELSARPRYLDLLAGRISIDNAVIDQPRVTVDMTGDCTRQQPQEKTIKIENESAQSASQSPALLLAAANIDLTVRDGDFKITAPDANNDIKTLELKSINSTLALRPLGSESNFDVSMTVASDRAVSEVSTAGKIKTARDGWSFADTSGELSLKVNELDLAALGPLFKVLDVNMSAAGTVSAAVDAKIQKGQFEKLLGNINAKNLDVTGDVLKGDRIQTAKLNSAVSLNTNADAINIDNLKIETDGLTADAKGTIPKTMTSWESFMKADSADSLQAKFDCDVAKTFKQFKTIAGFKENFDINYGRLSGDINTEAQNGKRVLSGNIKLWALEGKFPVKKIVLSKPVTLDAKLSSQQDKITVEKFAFDSAFAKANLSGTADNMNYQANIDLAKMQSDVGQFIEFKQALFGDVNLVGRAAFKENLFSSTGSGLLRNFTMVMPDGKQIAEPSGTAKYDFTADLNAKKLTIRSADATASVGKINLKESSIPLDEKSGLPMNVSADVAIDLAKTKQYLNAFTAFDPKASLSGTAQGDIWFAIKNGVIDASTKQIVVKGLSLSYPGQQTFTQEYMNISFSGKFDTVNKISNIEKITIDSPQIKLDGRLSNAQSGQNVRTEGSFKADYSLAAVTSLISPFMPSGLSATGNRSDTITFSSVYPKQQPALFKSNLNADGTFGFDTAQYMGFDIGKTDFRIKIDKGQMVLAPFSTTVNQGRLNFAANADFKSEPSMFRTPGPMKMFDAVQINRRTTDELLTYVNPIFANLLDVSGVLTFDSEELAFPLEKGCEKNITVVGILAVNNLRLTGSDLLSQIAQVTGGSQGSAITISPTKFVLRDGILSYDNMQMLIGDRQVNFQGRIGLDKSMTMTVTLPWTRNGQNVKLPLKGSVDKPQIDLGLLLQDQLQKEIENQLQNIFKR